MLSPLTSLLPACPISKSPGLGPPQRLGGVDQGPSPRMPGPQGPLGWAASASNLAAGLHPQRSYALSRYLLTALWLPLSCISACHAPSSAGAGRCAGAEHRLRVSLWRFQRLRLYVAQRALNCSMDTSRKATAGVPITISGGWREEPGSVPRSSRCRERMG